MKNYKKWDIVLASLDPTVGAEIAKTRPVLIVSPDAANKVLRTVIVVPLTSTIRDYPTRLRTTHKGKSGALAFDQIKTIDKSRIVKGEGTLDKMLRATANDILREMFLQE